MRKIENVVALRNSAAVRYQRNRRRFVIISKCQRIRESFRNEHEDSTADRWVLGNITSFGQSTSSTAPMQATYLDKTVSERDWLHTCAHLIENIFPCKPVDTRRNLWFALQIETLHFSYKLVSMLCWLFSIADSPNSLFFKSKLIYSTHRICPTEEKEESSTQHRKESKTIANNRTSMKMSNNFFGKQLRTEMRIPMNMVHQMPFINKSEFQLPRLLFLSCQFLFSSLSFIILIPAYSIFDCLLLGTAGSRASFFPIYGNYFAANYR